MKAQHATNPSAVRARRNKHAILARAEKFEARRNGKRGGDMATKPLAVIQARVALRDSGERNEDSPEEATIPTLEHFQEAVAATVSATWPWLTAKVEATLTDS